jgi:2'-5' RNA ligase
LDSIRSFISFNIDSSLQNRLGAIQNDVKAELKDQKVKWEDPGKFHLTIRFLGNVEGNILREILKELALIDFEFDNISMTSCGIGFFPNRKRPNVVFIDLNDPGNLSDKLVYKIDSTLDNFGFKPDKKFIPHITIGRFKRENRIRLGEQIKVKVEPIKINFSSFFLMKSVLTPRGSVYEVISEFKFHH